MAAVAHNSFVIAHILTKFGTETENDVRKAAVPSDFSFDKIEDGGGRHC